MTEVNWPTQPTPDAVLLDCTLNIEPVTKGRARIYRNEATGQVRGVTPDATKQYEEKLGWLLRSKMRGARNDVDDLGVALTFYVSGQQRRDIDNLIKAFLDGCNGIVWHDDVQVSTLTSRIIRGSDSPRIDALVYVEHRRATTCAREGCGAALSRKQINAGQLLCGKKCYDQSQRTGVYRACVGCGTAVYRQNDKAGAAKVYCTPECRATSRGRCRHCHEPLPPGRTTSPFCGTDCSDSWHRNRPTTAKLGGSCADCGRAVSRSSTRCRACFYAALRSGAAPKPVRTNRSGRAEGAGYDSCACGKRKRLQAERCGECFRTAVRAGEAGPWASGQQQ